MLEVILAGVGMSPNWRSRGDMSMFYTVSNGELFLPFSLLPFFSPLSSLENVIVCFYFLMVAFSVCSIGVECSVSMDSVLWGHYQGKLEHRVVPLYETLPPPVTCLLPLRFPHNPWGVLLRWKGSWVPILSWPLRLGLAFLLGRRLIV